MMPVLHQQWENVRKQSEDRPVGVLHTHPSVLHTLTPPGRHHHPHHQNLHYHHHHHLTINFDINPLLFSRPATPICWFSYYCHQRHYDHLQPNLHQYFYPQTVQTMETTIPILRRRSLDQSSPSYSMMISIYMTRFCCIARMMVTIQCNVGW